MFKTPLMLACAGGIAAVLASASLAAESPGVLKGADGKQIGTITATEGPRGVLLRIEARGLPSGWHGVHFHQKGTCADTGFKASGGHVHAVAAEAGAEKPTVVHGLLNPEANDSGDLPNIHVAANGELHAELYSTMVSLDGADGRPALKDADGSALVIHANPDDHKSQPIGGAGDRIACAVIP